jgi:ribosomal protein L11 methyltransferase
LTDYLLQISYPRDLEEVVFGRLFLTLSRGNVSGSDGVLVAYFETAADRDAAADSLRDQPITMHFEDRDRVDWLDHYQQSLQPLFIGRSFVIAPDPSVMPGDTTRHQLVIPQAQAFGTGSHESTALCIEFLEELDLRDAVGLDIGCGSGILAFAMLRLGARRVVGFDVDPDTLGAMQENRAWNQTPASLFVGKLDALRGGSFDVVTMNILPEVIIPMLPAVSRHVRGSLILSGILASARGEILHASGDMRLASEREKGEWWAGRFMI